MHKITKGIAASVILATATVNVTYPHVNKDKQVKAETKLKTSSAQAFINSIAEDARILAAQNDLYASVMIAQAVLESGFGNSTLSQPPNNNLYGIKAKKGDKAVAKKTAENDKSGNVYYIVDDFRVYDTPADSMKDYVKIFSQSAWFKEYYAGVFKSATKSYKDATHALTGTYATDVIYEEKLNKIIEEYNLTQYDIPKEEVKIKYTESVYVVKKGQNINDVANEVNEKVSSIRDWNGLVEGDELWEGQQLIIVKQEFIVASDYVKDKTKKVLTKEYADSINIVESEVQKEENQENVIEQPANQTTPETPQEQVVSTPDEKEEKTETTENSAIMIDDQSKTEEEKIVEQAGKITTNTYAVNEGETLYSIATKLGTTIEELKTTNKINEDTVTRGQILIVKEEKEIEKTYTHEVIEGETLYSIAKMYETTTNTLKILNGLESNQLSVGQKLVIEKEDGKIKQKEKSEIIELGKNIYKVKKDVKMKKEAKAFSKKVMEIKKDETVIKKEVKDDWMKIEYAGKEGWVKKKKIKVEYEKSKIKKNKETELFTLHTVKTGESIYGIAEKYDTTVKEIKVLNKFEGEINLKIGQKIKIRRNY